MFKFAAVVCIGLGALGAGAQTVSPPRIFPGGVRIGGGAAMHESLTRQFEIREPDHAGGNPIPLGKDTGVRYVRVDPELLAVSCERIKHALLAEMDAPDNWHDKIFIDMRRARALNETVVIESSPYGRSWTYHVSLPDTVEEGRLVTSIVDVLLLEMANRSSKRPAELPAWLGYGLSQDIRRSSQIELVLEPAKQIGPGVSFGILTSAGTNQSPLALAHEVLQASPPLTLDQLSWPDDSRLDGPEGASFQSSAQLFVHELLQLRDGRKAMRAFIQKLPEHLNWQLSFLDAFRGDFTSQLDVEKWWALRVVDFTGRDILQTINPEQSWQKLNDIVRPVVEVRGRVNELPLRTQMTLQMIIQRLDVAQQAGLLRERSKLLYLLRSRVSQEMAKLVDDYRRTIDVYLDKRMRDGYLQTARSQAVIGLDRVARQTIADLDILDSIREDLRPKAETLQSADASGRVNH